MSLFVEIVVIAAFQIYVPLGRRFHRNGSRWSDVIYFWCFRIWSG